MIAGSIGDQAQGMVLSEDGNSGTQSVVASVVATSSSSNAAPPGRKLRGSCDFCTKRKRKCDGDGVNACSFCIAKKQPRCHYSVRLPTGPRRDPSSAGSHTGARRGSGGSERIAPAHGAAMVRGGSVTGDLVVREQAGNALAGGPSMPLKRARFSASPVTGLVGMKENDYLGDFFRTLGFLPLANESIIRKAMIGAMFAAFHGTEREDEGFSPQAIGDGLAGVHDAMVTRAPSEGAPHMVALTCTLWSTIALGALVQGRPKEAVTGYLQLARESLARCFDAESAEAASTVIIAVLWRAAALFRPDVPSVDAANSPSPHFQPPEASKELRAFAAMALVHNFIGDEGKCNKYVEFARNIVNSLPPNQVPQDISDTLLFIDMRDMFTFNSERYRMRRHESDRIRKKDKEWTPSESLKTPGIFRQSDVCRFILKTDVALSQSFYDDMEEHGVFDIESELSIPPEAISPAKLTPSYGGAAVATTMTRNPARYPEQGVTGRGGRGCGRPWKPKPGATEPPPPGQNSKKFAEEMKKEFEILEDAVDSPEIRDGVGSLSFNSISAYLNVLEGGLERAFEKILRCCDVVENNPGLMRFTLWKHVGHCILGVLASSCECQKYERVRQAYNSVMDEPGAILAPPLMEWGGMKDICDGVFCRSLYSQLQHPRVPDFEELHRQSEDDDGCETELSEPRKNDNVVPAILLGNDAMEISVDEVPQASRVGRNRSDSQGGDGSLRARVVPDEEVRVSSLSEPTQPTATGDVEISMSKALGQEVVVEEAGPSHAWPLWPVPKPTVHSPDSGAASTSTGYMSSMSTSSASSVVSQGSREADERSSTPGGLSVRQEGCTGGLIGQGDQGNVASTGSGGSIASSVAEASSERVNLSSGSGNSGDQQGLLHGPGDATVGGAEATPEVFRSSFSQGHGAFRETNRAQAEQEIAAGDHLALRAPAGKSNVGRPSDLAWSSVAGDGGGASAEQSGEAASDAGSFFDAVDALLDKGFLNGFEGDVGGDDSFGPISFDIPAGDVIGGLDFITG